jgi:hypothetical protein
MSRDERRPCPGTRKAHDETRRLLAIIPPSMKPSRTLRHLAVLTLVSCVATGFLRAEAYPLDDLSYEPPVGSVHTESTEVVR